MGTLVIMSEIMKLDETIDKIMTKTESGIVSELDKILDGAKSSLENLDRLIDNAKKRPSRSKNRSTPMTLHKNYFLIKGFIRLKHRSIGHSTVR